MVASEATSPPRAKTTTPLREPELMQDEGEDDVGDVDESPYRQSYAVRSSARRFTPPGSRTFHHCGRDEGKR
jgi:hypothetical protein